MSHHVLESLETRRHFAAAKPVTAFDPSYQFTAAELPASVGGNRVFFQAVAGANDRTYLLGLRKLYTVPNKKGLDTRLGELMVVAVDAKGNLDKGYGTGGVALTGRLLNATPINQPGLAKLDGSGRLYVADGTRVMRLRANGSNDLSFGQRGAAAYQPDSRPTLLCDIVPTADGVLVATTQTTRHVQRFAVQKIDRRVRTTWAATHDELKGGDSSSKYYAVSPQTAQFATNNGHIVLAAIQKELTYEKDSSFDGDPTLDVLVAKRQTLLVTGFDAAGNGTALGRKKLDPVPDQPYEASLGTRDERYPVVDNVYVSPTGRTVLAQTDAELIRVDTKTGAAEHFDFPDYNVQGYYRPNDYDGYRILSDGTLGGFTGGYTDPEVGDHPYLELSRFSFTGTPDKRFGTNGILRTIPTDDNTAVDQIFQGNSGRLYVLNNAVVLGESTELMLRRV